MSRPLFQSTRDCLPSMLSRFDANRITVTGAVVPTPNLETSDFESHMDIPARELKEIVKSGDIIEVVRKAMPRSLREARPDSILFTILLEFDLHAAHGWVNVHYSPRDGYELTYGIDEIDGGTAKVIWEHLEEIERLLERSLVEAGFTQF